MSKPKRWMSRDLNGTYNFHIQVKKPEPDEDGVYGYSEFSAFDEYFEKIAPNVSLEPGQCIEIEPIEIKLKGQNDE